MFHTDPCDDRVLIREFLFVSGGSFFVLLGELEILLLLQCPSQLLRLGLRHGEVQLSREWLPKKKKKKGNCISGTDVYWQYKAISIHWNLIHGYCLASIMPVKSKYISWISLYFSECRSWTFLWVSWIWRFFSSISSFNSFTWVL